MLVAEKVSEQVRSDVGVSIIRTGQRTHYPTYLACTMNIRWPVSMEPQSPLGLAINERRVQSLDISQFVKPEVQSAREEQGKNNGSDGAERDTCDLSLSYRNH